MRIPKLRLAAIALAGLGLSGCTTYDPFGYGGLSVGYGSGGYYDPYYGGYGYGYSPYGYQSSYGYSPYGYQSSYGYSPYGYQPSYGYGSSYYGWNDGYYYPGSGYYVYDTNRRPHRWNDSQRRYWAKRTTTTKGTNAVRQNWTGFTRGRDKARTERSDGDRSTSQDANRNRRGHHGHSD